MALRVADGGLLVRILMWDEVKLGWAKSFGFPDGI
jgi:hypothetical protein